MTEQSLVWIEDVDALQALASDIDGAGILAVDTESDSFFVHREKVCTLQLKADDGPPIVVDTIALRDLTPLKAIFADPATVKILHGADYDVVCLQRDFGLEFRGLFDTMIAARYLGRPSIGLAALCLEFFGVEMDKSLTRHDWARRPVEPKYVRYLVDDVLYLEKLREHLVAELKEAGIAPEAEEEFGRISRLQWSKKPFDPDGYRAIKGFRDLDRRAHAALKALFCAREQISSELDLPPFRVLNNQAMMEMARRAPRSVADLLRQQRFPRAVGRDQMRTFVDALDAARAGDVDATPPSRAPRSGSARDTRLVDVLKAWRRDAAEARGVVTEVVLPNHAMQAIVEQMPATLRELERIPWLGAQRIERHGDAILACLRPE